MSRCSRRTGPSPRTGKPKDGRSRLDNRAALTGILLVLRTRIPPSAANVAPI
ncbi:hypothetical protein J2852_001945 [Azospirillum soli]|nr:hypothetical protein [Azospirillum soli]